MKCLETATIITIISLLNWTSADLLQLSLPPSVDALEGGSVTLPCSFSPLPISLNGLFINWWIISDRSTIYDSHFGNSRPKVAQFVGDEHNGNCSLRILNVSSTDNLEFRCYVYCDTCKSETVQVEGRVKLNVTAAAPQSHGDAGGMTGAPEVENSPTPGVSSWETGLLVGVILGVILVVGAAFIIILFKKPRWLRRISHLSDSGNRKTDLHVDIKEKPLVTNGQRVDEAQGQEEHQQNGTNVI